MTESTKPFAAERSWRRRKEDRPGEIIEAGLLEFAGHGYAGTKLEDVARRAGIVKGTIYRYFPSKEALFEAALKSKSTPIFGHIDSLVETYSGSSAELLRTVVANLYRQMFGSSLSVLLRIIIAEGGRFPAIAKLYHEQLVAKGKGALDRIVKRGVESGEFRAGAVAGLPMIIVSPAIMAMVWKMTFDAFEPIALERFIEAHTDLVLHGLVAKEHELPPRRRRGA